MKKIISFLLVFIFSNVNVYADQFKNSKFTIIKSDPNYEIRQLKKSLQSTQESMTEIKTGEKIAAGGSSIGVIAGGVSVCVMAAEGTSGAAFITSGLAGVGSWLGGGMVVGIGIVATMPVLVGLLSWGTYYLITG